MFPVVTVADAAAWLTEPLGSKRKFWFQHESSTPYLFKEARSGTGEDWSEKVACELCCLLGLPHVHYDLAIWKHNRGVVCPLFVSDDGQLVHGNELLVHLLPAYPRQQFFGVSQHTLEHVLAILQNGEIHMPIGWAPFPGIDAAVDVFIGYLMLDAWIGNGAPSRELGPGGTSTGHASGAIV